MATKFEGIASYAAVAVLAPVWLIIVLVMSLVKAAHHLATGK